MEGHLQHAWDSSEVRALRDGWATQAFAGVFDTQRYQIADPSVRDLHTDLHSMAAWLRALVLEPQPVVRGLVRLDIAPARLQLLPLAAQAAR